MILFFPPPKIIQPHLLSYKPAQHEIIEYLNKYGFVTDIKDGHIYIERDKEKIIYNMMENMETMFISSFRVFPIKKEIRISKAVKEVRDLVTNWEVLPEQRVLIAPADDEMKVQELVGHLLSNDVECHCCYMMCEKPRESRICVTTYSDDGQTITKPVCLHCIDDFIEASLSNIEDSFKNISKIPPITFGGFCPIGQFMLATTNEISNIPKYFEYVVNSTYHSNPDKIGTCECNPNQLVNLTIPCPNCGKYTCPKCKQRHRRKDYCPGVPTLSCPDHPRFVVTLNQPALCPYCGKHFCFFCKKWHFDNDKCVDNDHKHCPRCHTPVFKIEGCNHITCICGAHWCYKCGAGPYDESYKCYDHMSKVHGGCFDYHFD